MNDSAGRNCTDRDWFFEFAFRDEMCFDSWRNATGFLISKWPA